MKLWGEMMPGEGTLNMEHFRDLEEPRSERPDPDPFQRFFVDWAR